MNPLQSLYQEVILDHNHNPRNFGALENANANADGHNSLCGDFVHIDLLLEKNVIADIRFSGKGCAVSKSSASIMTEIIKEKNTKEFFDIFQKFQEFLTEKDAVFPSSLPEKLRVFEGVKKYPMRVKCAILPWHTLKSAIETNEGF